MLGLFDSRVILFWHWNSLYVSLLTLPFTLALHQAPVGPVGPKGNRRARTPWLLALRKPRRGMIKPRQRQWKWNLPWHALARPIVETQLLRPMTDRTTVSMQKKMCINKMCAHTETHTHTHILTHWAGNKVCQIGSAQRRERVKEKVEFFFPI